MESGISDYKGKNIIEKSWMIYNVFCDISRSLNKLKNMNDDNQKRPVISSYATHIPNFEDLRGLLSHELTSISDFVKMYCETLDIELDEEIVWPYHWHINL